jgi:hypothetical protein
MQDVPPQKSTEITAPNFIFIQGLEPPQLAQKSNVLTKEDI